MEWATAAPGDVGLSARALDALHGAIVRDWPHVTALLVARGGVPVFERYYRGAAHDARDTQSVTKSVVSALVGVALRRGLLGSLDERLLAHLPLGEARLNDPRWHGVTVRHLLTHTSGLPSELADPAYDDAWFLGPDPVRFALERRLVADPGRAFHYANAGVHLLGALLAQVSGMNLRDFARRELLGPLGIEARAWPSDPQGRPFAGGSLHLTAREMLAFGEFVRRRGEVGGAPLVPAGFIEDATRAHVRGHVWMEGIADYGHLWWVTRERGTRGWYATGYGGQYVAVFPDLALVAVVTGEVGDHPNHRRVIADGVVGAAVPRSARGPSAGPGGAG